MRKMSQQLDACEMANFCAVCGQYKTADEVTDNVCSRCAQPSDELRFSRMDDPSWCCECCLSREDVKVEGHVCEDCKK